MYSLLFCGSHFGGCSFTVLCGYRRRSLFVSTSPLWLSAAEAARFQSPLWFWAKTVSCCSWDEVVRMYGARLSECRTEAALLSGTVVRLNVVLMFAALLRL